MFLNIWLILLTRPFFSPSLTTLSLFLVPFLSFFLRLIFFILPALATSGKSFSFSVGFQTSGEPQPQASLRKGVGLRGRDDTLRFFWTCCCAKAVTHHSRHGDASVTTCMRVCVYALLSHADGAADAVCSTSVVWACCIVLNLASHLNPSVSHRPVFSPATTKPFQIIAMFYNSVYLLSYRVQEASVLHSVVHNGIIWTGLSLHLGSHLL